MSPVAPEIPAIEDQTAFNLARWEEICADPVLAKLAFRIESDAHGHILMSPPPAPEHGDFQSILVILLHQHLPKGKITAECPISTPGGVRAADVAWSSVERRSAQRGQKALTIAPEICVEVLSPSNTRAEIEEKKQLYFDAGAEEVWICGLDGALRIFLSSAPDELSRSLLCPDLPDRLPDE